MMRRHIALLALAAALPLAPRAQDREWEEDYSGQDAPAYDQPIEQPQPSDSYDVSVDLNDSGSVNLDTFQGSLSPYGEWVNTGSYGTVWRPRVAQGWRPYYYGRWEWTNEGWLWVSDEPFGWATYHYGRWTYDGSYGWVWVPGYQWAPAWVAWRASGDVIGWAPLGPGLSVYVSTYPFVDYWWTFVPTARFCSHPVYSVAYAPGYSRRYFYETAPAPARPAAFRPAPGRVMAPAPAWGGPAPRLVEQRMGRALTPVRVVAAPSPGAARVRPGEVSIFRPGARPATAPGFRGGAAPAPGSGGAYPPARGNGRGPGPAPAPGNGGYYPPSRGNGRGPGPAPAPGNGGYYPPNRGNGRGPGPAPAPGRSDGGFVPAPRSGVRGPAVAPPAQTRGGYAPPAAPSRGYAPPPAQSRGYSAPAAPSRGGGYASPPSQGRGSAAPAAPQGGGRAAPARGERERR